MKKRNIGKFVTIEEDQKKYKRRQTKVALFNQVAWLMFTELKCKLRSSFDPLGDAFWH